MIKLMRPEVQKIASQVKGFLSIAEGTRLFELACESSLMGPCVEIGTYCGKSALFLGEGCRTAARFALFSIDHHRGSEEQQKGGEYFDPELYDARLGRINTLPHSLANLDAAGLAEWVVPVVGHSVSVARSWPGARLGLVFIDGGHSENDVAGDYAAWSPLIMRGGHLCFHDIYPNPSDGGQAPYRTFERARSLPEWSYIGLYESLGVLKRR